MELTKGKYNKQVGLLKITKNEIFVEVRDKDKRMIRQNENRFRKGTLIREIRENTYNKFYNEIGGSRRRDTILEDKMSFVPMAYAFYFYLTNVEHIPSVETFCNFFLNSFCEKVSNGYHFKEQYANNDHVFNKHDLFGKICRAYNSYLREFMLLETLFELQKKDKYKDLDIFYDIDEDIYNGVDIVVKNGEKTIGLLITQKSRNANKYNYMKRDHRHEYKYDDYIYVKMNEDETEKVGDTELFTKKVARNILDEILEK